MSRRRHAFNTQHQRRETHTYYNDDGMNVKESLNPITQGLWKRPDAPGLPRRH